MIQPGSERDRLTKCILEFARVRMPRLRPDDYFRLRARLEKTRIEVLREILEEDIVNTAAAAVLPRELVVR